MSNGDCAARDRHKCGCGESFESTDRLLEHAREAHGLFVH
jgi:hypothetical protein